MEWIFIAAVVYGIWRVVHWFFGLFSPRPKLAAGNKRVLKKLEDNMPWLEERWESAKHQKDGSAVLPDWFSDPVTSRQLEKLKELGVEVSKKNINKGRASDLIGLFYPYDDEDVQKLKYFKIPLSGLSQSKARHELSKIPVETMHFEGWKDRPATALDREYLRFFKLTAPKGMTQRQAEDIRSRHQSELPDSQQSRIDEWDHFEMMFEDFQDKDFRSDYELKTVSIKDFKAATLALMREGEKFMDFDSGQVADKLLEIMPQLEKS